MLSHAAATSLPAEPTPAAAHGQYLAVYRFALALVRDEPRAADLTQQAFLVWARKGHQLRDPDKVRAWLFTTLRREHLRDCRRQARFPLVAFDENVHHEIAAPAAGPGSLADRLDADEVMRAAHALREVHRAPLLLFYRDNLSYTQIAAALDLRLGTVMSRLSRAKAELRALLHLDGSATATAV